jgi:metal-responsive CopG/Arc/MetJ family transcriptional regulator
MRSKQYKTTLKEPDAMKFDAACKAVGKRESEVIRNAIREYLQTALIRPVLNKHSERIPI